METTDTGKKEDLNINIGYFIVLNGNFKFVLESTFIYKTWTFTLNVTTFLDIKTITYLRSRHLIFLSGLVNNPEEDKGNEALFINFIKQTNKNLLIS